MYPGGQAEESGDNLHNELLQASYEAAISHLESATYWTQLSESQKSLILLSLYPYDLSSRQIQRSSTFSEDQILSEMAFCHTAVMSVEAAENPDYATADLYNGVDKHFFSGSVFSIAGASDPVAAIEHGMLSHDGPVVVQPWYANMYAARLYPSHSLIAFGQDSTGSIVCWDKGGFGPTHPYRVYNFPEVMSTFGGAPYWGIRELRNLSTIDGWAIEDIKEMDRRYKMVMDGEAPYVDQGYS